MIAFNLSHYLVDYIHHYRKYAVIQKNGSYFIPAILLSHSDVVPMTVLTLQLVAAGSHCSATGKNAGHSITSPSCPMEPSIGGYPGYPTTFLLISAASDIPQNLKSSSCIPIPNIYIYTTKSDSVPLYPHWSQFYRKCNPGCLLSRNATLWSQDLLCGQIHVCMGTHTKNIHSSPFPIHKCQGPGKVSTRM